METIWQQLNTRQRLRTWGAVSGLWMAYHLILLIAVTLGEIPLIIPGWFGGVVGLLWPLVSLGLALLVSLGYAPRIAYAVACLAWAAGWFGYTQWPLLSGVFALSILALGYGGEKTCLMLGLEHRMVWPWTVIDIPAIQAQIADSKSDVQLPEQQVPAMDIAPPQPEDKARLGLSGKISRRKLEFYFLKQQQALQSQRRQGVLKPMAYQRERRELEWSYRRLLHRWEQGRKRHINLKKARSASAYQPAPQAENEREKLTEQLKKHQYKLHQLNQKIRVYQRAHRDRQGRSFFSWWREFWLHLSTYEWELTIGASLEADIEEEGCAQGCFLYTGFVVSGVIVSILYDIVGAFIDLSQLPEFVFIGLVIAVFFLLRFFPVIMDFIQYALRFSPDHFDLEGLKSQYQKGANLSQLRKRKQALREKIRALERQHSRLFWRELPQQLEPLVVLGSLNLLLLLLWAGSVWIRARF